MKLILSLYLLAAVPFMATADPGNAQSGDQGSRVILAQNTRNGNQSTSKKTDDTELTPLPPAKFTISTEKPVKGIPGEAAPVTEEPAEQSPVQGVRNLKPGEAQNMATSQPALTPSAETSTQTANAPAVTVPSATVPSATVPSANVPSATVPSANVPSANVPSATVPTAPADSSQTATPPAASRDMSGVPPDIQQQIARQSGKEPDSMYLLEELSILNVPTGNLRTMKYIIDDLYRLKGMVYGDEQGYIHILEANDNGDFRETWKSPPFNSPIRGVFVEDLDSNGSTEIVAYTADGNFAIYGYESHDLMYKTPEGTYQNINCMVVHNMDSDPQKEIFFIGVDPNSSGAADGQPAGNFIQFDPTSQFEEWKSSDTYTATDMLVGNVDTDDDEEIILNTGEILNKQFKDVEWRSTIELGSRLYLVDMDNDGIMELITEFAESYVRIIDVDQRREKW